MQFISEYTNTNSAAESSILGSGLTQIYSNLQNAQLGKGFSSYFSQQSAIDSYATESDSAYWDKKAQEEEDRKKEDEKRAIEAQIRLMEQFKSTTYDLIEEEKSSLAGEFISPYSMHDEENSSAMASENIRFNKEEVNSLIEKLKKDGYANEKVLNAIKEAGKSINGVTGETLMNSALTSLAGEKETLTKLEEQKLLSLSQKLANSSMSGEEVFDFLKSADSQQALGTMSELLGQKGSLSFSKDELSAFSSMLGLSKDEQAKIENLFNSANTGSLTLDKNSFDNAFSSAKQELLTKQDEIAHLASELSEKIGSLESDARNRIAFEETTKQYEDRRTELTRTQMESTVLKNVMDSFKDNSLKQDLKKDVLSAQMQLMKNENNGQGDSLDSFSFEDGMKGSSFENSLKSALHLGNNETGNNKDAANQEKKEFAFLLPTDTNALLGDKANNTKATAGTPSFTSTMLTSQVTDALSSAAKGNISKLEVKLNPVELGALNVVLTSKDGELNATIKSEKEDTMQLINQQVNIIKKELEAQGITISSINVEVNSEQEHETSFANAHQEHELNQQNEQNRQGQHSQEDMQAQVDELARLRMIGRGLSEGWISKENLTSQDIALVENMEHKLQEPSNNSGLDKNLTLQTYSSEADSYIKVVA